MSNRDRSNWTPNLPKVIKITLTEGNLRNRLIALVVLLAIGFTAIGVGLKEAFTTDPGWKTIECYTEELAYSADITLQYYMGGEGVNATAQERALNAAYGEAMADAYRIFNSEVLDESNHNVAYLNAHLNEVVTVEPALYDALALLENAGLHYARLGAVYAEYQPVFLSGSDGEAENYDPMKDAEAAAWVEELTAVVTNPDMVTLELLADHQVCLRVSEEYLAFAEENGVDTILDLSWMTNAFVIDYVAEKLMEQGLTAGYLVSYDGFTRNLGGTEETFQVNLFARAEEGVHVVGALAYSGATSMVALRDHPMSEADLWHYRTYEDGSITSVYLSPADGLSKAAVTDLVVYSGEMSCAELVIHAAPVFISDSFQRDALSVDGMNALWNQGRVIYHTSPDANITMDENSGFTLKLAE